MSEPGARRIKRSSYYEQYEPSTITLEEYRRLQAEGDAEKVQVTPHSVRRADG